MRTKDGLAGLLCALPLFACSQVGTYNDERDQADRPIGALVEDDDEVAIPLDEVPADVLASARAAVPGIELLSAEVETEDGRQVYDIEGKLDGAFLEVEVTEKGEVLEIEKEDLEDEDDD